MTETGTHLAVFAKFWRPGLVKTRLAEKIGEARAATLYRAFVKTTLRRLDGLAQRHELCFWPSDHERDFREILPLGWELSCQEEGDLGQRMRAFFDRSLASGSSRVVLVGSDAPNVPVEFIVRAFELLKRAAVVLGPSRDGGYYLVGAEGKTPPIFRSIAWSTPAVWDQTIAALEASGLRRGDGFAETPPFGDVDTWDDLLSLRAQLRSSRPTDAALSRLAIAVDEAFT